MKIPEHAAQTLKQVPVNGEVRVAKNHFSEVDGISSYQLKVSVQMVMSPDTYPRTVADKDMVNI